MLEIRQPNQTIHSLSCSSLLLENLTKRTCVHRIHVIGTCQSCRGLVGLLRLGIRHFPGPAGALTTSTLHEGTANSSNSYYDAVCWLASPFSSNPSFLSSPLFLHDRISNKTSKNQPTTTALATLASNTPTTPPSRVFDLLQ